MVELVKASAVASAIAVGDVTYQSIMIWTQRDNVLALMLLILAFFGVLTWLVTLARPLARTTLQDSRLWLLIRLPPLGKLAARSHPLAARPLWRARGAGGRRGVVVARA